MSEKTVTYLGNEYSASDALNIESDANNWHTDVTKKIIALDDMIDHFRTLIGDDFDNLDDDYSALKGLIIAKKEYEQLQDEADNEVMIAQEIMELFDKQ